MNLLRNRIFSILGLSFALATSAGALVACDDPITEQCNLSCPAEGVLEGNASISGVISVDAFFSGVISLRDSASATKGALLVELRGLAADLNLTVDANASIEQLSAAIEAELKAKIAANVEGSLTVKADPPRCEASIEVVAKASAECDVKAMPGSVKVQCNGSCEIDASASAMCTANGTLKCDVQMPGATCMGECSGSCELEAAGGCEGKCEGKCEGTCSACLGGTCNTEGGVITNCVGTCSGGCTGSCKLEAKAECSGKCEGRCEYTPPAGMCEANAKVSCEAMANAEIECKGGCEGEVKPPTVSAECKAAVEAKAKAEVVCTPGQLTVDFQWKADASVEAKAEFRALMSSFKVRFASMLALKTKLEGIGQAAGDLSVSGVAAVEGSINTAVSAAASGDIKLAAGLNCGLKQLPQATTALKTVATDVTASVSAFAKVSGAVGTSYTR